MWSEEGLLGKKVNEGIGEAFSLWTVASIQSHTSESEHYFFPKLLT